MISPRNDANTETMPPPMPPAAQAQRREFQRGWATWLSGTGVGPSRCTNCYLEADAAAVIARATGTAAEEAAVQLEVGDQEQRECQGSSAPGSAVAKVSPGASGSYPAMGAIGKGVSVLESPRVRMSVSPQLMPRPAPPVAWELALQWCLAHPPGRRGRPWCVRDHFQFCGQSCPCCRFLAGDRGGCPICRDACALIAVSRATRSC